MDDLQRPPADSDRERMAARIKKAYDEGRIGAADRDIRLGNVRSAQSMTELDLMSRDLDLLESALPAATPQASAPATPYSKFNPKSRAGLTAKASGRRTGIIVSIVVGIAVIVAAAAAVIGFASSDGGSSSGTTTAPSHQKPDDPPPRGPAYKLTAKGINDVLAAYRDKFGTSKVVELTFYEDYVIVGVPVPGKARQTGWLYRNDIGWRGFGGVRATFPGSEVVDTNQLAVPALMRNVARARRTLNVETPS